MEGGGKAMGPNERRKAIIEVLCKRRHDTMKNLAFEFGVSDRTIRNDITILSLSYPLITTRGRYGGGVSVINNFSLNQKYLKPEQQKLLQKLSTSLSGDDLILMESILEDFALNK